MSITASTDISNLTVVRRLLEMDENAKARRKGKDVGEKSALEYMEEDQALISSAALDAQKVDANSMSQIENINLNLSDFKKQISDLSNEHQAVSGVTVRESQSIEIEMELRYRSNTPIDGLVVHDQHYAESDRYLFKFANGSTFTILDKWTNKSTTIWGDPHVDVDDVEGNNDGDFKDLKSSDDLTTFMLGDGTRVTFKAKDAGIIEQVDIFKGSQHIKGTGEAAKDFSPVTGLFSGTVLKDGMSMSSATPLGDVVHSGGDGNDWFDANNKLVWGKTTGPVINQRPPATLEFFYRQTVSHSLSIQTSAVEA